MFKFRSIKREINEITIKTNKLLQNDNYFFVYDTSILIYKYREEKEKEEKRKEIKGRTFLVEEKY